MKNKTLRFFKAWLERLGRKDGYIDYITTHLWLEEDEFCLQALMALVADE